MKKTFRQDVDKRMSAIVDAILVRPLLNNAKLGDGRSLEDAIDEAGEVKLVSVDTLPTASEATMNAIYFVPSSNPGEKDQSDEYITKRSGTAGSYTYAWEKIGSTAAEAVFEAGAGLHSAVLKGNGAQATGAGAVSEGDHTKANAQFAHAEGKYAKALGNFSHAEGGAASASAGPETTHNIAQGSGSHAEGYGMNYATGAGSHAEGNHAMASGFASHAEGTFTTASGNSAHAEGYGTGDGGTDYNNGGIFAGGAGSHAEGRCGSDDAVISASGSGAHAEGHAEAGTILAQGNGSHAGGYTEDTISATGEGSFAHGCAPNGSILATAEGAHAEGYVSSSGEIKASALGAHAEGVSVSSSNKSHASGIGSHVEGNGCQAAGRASHAEGEACQAGSNAHCSHVEGDQCITSNNGEHAEGKCNQSHRYSATWGNAKNTLHSVGIGTNNTTGRKNAFEIMQNGDAYFYGLGGYDGTNPGESGIKSLVSFLDSLPRPELGVKMDSGDYTEAEAEADLGLTTAIWNRMFAGKVSQIGVSGKPDAIATFVSAGMDGTNPFVVYAYFHMSGGIPFALGWTIQKDSSTGDFTITDIEYSIQ